MMEEKGNSLLLSTMAVEPDWMLRSPEGQMKDTISRTVRISNAMAQWPATEENFADHWWCELVKTDWPVVSFDLWSMNTN